MARVQAIDSNLYDVLGVSPNDSAQEIDAAFHRLIEGGGYRIGVPLRGQWLRAHQIKEAYATLGDPIKRRAYDESLKGDLERPLWPAPPDNDPGLSALLRPLGAEQPPPEPTFKWTAAAPDSSDDKREQAAVGAIGSGNEEIDPHVDSGATLPGDGKEERAPVAAIESDDKHIVAEADEHAAWPDEDASRNDVRYGSAKLWGGAAAAALALGSLVYFGWPSETPQLSGTEKSAQLPQAAQQPNSGARVTGPLAELPPAVVPDEPPVGGSLDVSVETPAATETAVPAAAPAQVAVASETQAPADAVASGGKVASATAPELAPVLSGPTSTAAEAAAPAAPAPAPLPPLAQAPSPVPPSPPAAQPKARASESVRPRAGVIRTSAQWLGGGPTHSDNRGGRHVGRVVVQFTVQADGRASNCGPVRSSGNAGLDALTCRLFEQRARFRPALDAQGNPVASTAHARYEWGSRRRHRSLLSSIFR